MEESVKDFDHCPFADDMASYYYEVRPDDVFADVSSYILPIIRKPLAHAYNLTKE